MSDLLIDPTMRALRSSLDLRQTQQNVISSNIANADTPGYKAQAVEFETELREAVEADDRLQLESTHPDHFGKLQPEEVEAKVFDDPNGIESLDGNTVNRSQEMAKMVETQQLYNASVEMLKKKLGMLKYSISEGGGDQ